MLVDIIKTLIENLSYNFFSLNLTENDILLRRFLLVKCFLFNSQTNKERYIKSESFSF